MAFGSTDLSEQRIRQRACNPLGGKVYRAARSIWPDANDAHDCGMSLWVPYLLGNPVHKIPKSGSPYTLACSVSIR